MISVRNLVKTFGGIRAVDGCTLDIAESTITGLIGPNGAGKTTLFDIIAGFMRPDSGRIELAGRDITGMAPHRLFHLGLIRTFQIPHAFSRMTVLESLMVVPSGQSGESMVSAWLRWGKVRREERELRRKAEKAIDFLQLSEVKNELAGNLSGGQKKLLELGRANSEYVGHLDAGCLLSKGTVNECPIQIKYYGVVFSLHDFPYRQL